MEDQDGNVIVALLQSIDNTLKELLKRSKAKAGKPVADDADLDSTWGDPIVKLMPRDWAGENYKGRPLSQCSPEFLDKLGDMFDYFGAKNEREGKKTTKGKDAAPFDFQAAARCRGWAKRKRAGWTPPKPSAGFAAPEATGFGADPFAGKSGFGQSQGFGESHFEDDQM